MVSRFDRKPIGRPVLYVAIDIASRMIAGIYVGFEESAEAVLTCLANAACDKVDFCKEHGICLACILSSDEDDKPQFTEDLLSTYLKNTKKEKLPAINEKALEAVYSKIESTPDDDKSKQTIAYDAFTEHELNPPSRAFFAVYASRYKNFDSCSNDIYTNALLAMMLLGNINTTAKVRYMERYDYLYRTIVRPRFAAKSFGATWINDSNTMRRKTGIERDEENALQMPLIATLTASGVMNQQRMDKQVLSKEMLMHMAVAAYTAASIDKVDAPLEKAWEAIDAGNESSYDSETVQIAKEKVKIFRTALFNATYYTMLCEQTKKTVLDGLQDYFFNPQGTRLNNELLIRVFLVLPALRQQGRLPLPRVLRPSLLITVLASRKTATTRMSRQRRLSHCRMTTLTSRFLVKT